MAKDGWSITRQELEDAPFAGTFNYSAQDGQLGTMLSAMFKTGPKKSMTGRMKPIGGDGAAAGIGVGRKKAKR